MPHTMSRLAAFLRAVAALLLLLSPIAASAQELEPGAYWPIPRGLNIVTVVNSFNFGDVAFDPAAPIDEARARINTMAFVLTRAFSLAGRSANAGLVVPMVGGHVEGLYLGEPAEVDRFGLGDPRLRMGVNLYGAPAMTPKEFASYRHHAIVGLSLTVAPPLGQDDGTKLINLGTNRWSFKPEIGVSRAYGAAGHWVVEGMAGVWIFTNNTNFVGGRTREQDPIAAVQIHLTYKFTRSMWLAADANFFTGGRTTIGGTAEHRFAAQLPHRHDVFVGDQPESGHSSIGEPRRLHDYRGQLHLARRRLQLRVGAVTEAPATAWHVRHVPDQCPPPPRPPRPAACSSWSDHGLVRPLLKPRTSMTFNGSTAAPVCPQARRM